MIDQYVDQSMGVLLYLLLTLSFSSFIGVMIDRVPSEQSLLGRSTCASCGQIVRWKHNFPILSWLYLRGRCRSCDSPIPQRLLFIEILATFLYLLVWVKSDNFIDLLLWFGYVTFGFSLTMIDLAHNRLPNSLTFPFFIFTSLVTVSAFIFQQISLTDLRRVFSICLLNLAFYSLLRLLSKGGMGLGDVKLAPTLGLVCGYYSLSFFIISSYITFLLAGLVASLLLITKKAKMKTALAFGPYMLAAPYLVFLFS